MIPPTTRRVPEHTAEYVNQRIREQTRANVERYSQAGPAAVDRRLRKLDEEWDIERTLEANAATLAAAGAALALLGHVDMRRKVDIRFVLRSATPRLSEHPPAMGATRATLSARAAAWRTSACGRGWPPVCSSKCPRIPRPPGRRDVW